MKQHDFKDYARIPEHVSLAYERAVRSLEEEKPVKKKLSVGVIFAIVLTIVAATALAAYAILSRAPMADAAFQARKALKADYGLTTETIGLFHMEMDQDGDTWIVHFYPIGFYPRPLGEYQVTLTPKKEPETHWTYDEIDPLTWQDGSLDSPVWGQLQLLKVLEDRAAAVDALSRMDQVLLTDKPYMPQEPPGMESLQEDESIWFGHILRNAEPGPEDISQEKAIDVAREAIMEENPLMLGMMKTAELADVLSDFKSRDDGNPLWMVQFFASDKVTFQDWGVVVDARTGEILYSNVVTGEY